MIVWSRHAIAAGHEWARGKVGLVEELPGGNSQAETLDEVRENLREGGSHTASVNPTAHKASTVFAIGFGREPRWLSYLRQGVAAAGIEDYARLQTSSEPAA